MDPADALDAIAEILETNREPTYRVRAFRNAAKTVRDAGIDEIEALVGAGKVTDRPGIGDKTALVIRQAVEGQTPDYLLRLEKNMPKQADGPGAALRVLLKGDLHLHSDWSDGGSPIKAMAETARS
ncbi:MAG TPA: PHP domain-containing protein, partial [Acidimicrobiales bacterium]|nr:PHP domain-containing protein [Acidimicrobiales bacterium]